MQYRWVQRLGEEGEEKEEEVEEEEEEEKEKKWKGKKKEQQQEMVVHWIDPATAYHLGHHHSNRYIPLLFIVR